MLQKRVAFLTNILLPHRVAVLECFAPLVEHLRVFLSAVNESDRKQAIDWRTLDVEVQKSLRWSRRFTNVHGYRDVSHIQIPYDTYLQLQRYRPDVILSGEFGGRTIFASLYRMLHPSSRLIVWATLSQRTERQRGRVRTLLRRWILCWSDACFVHGPDGEAYIRSFGYKRPAFHIPYVVDNSNYAGARSVPDDDVLRIFYAGQLIERKGVLPFSQALLRWCGEHPQQQVDFRLAGDGEERQRIEALPLPTNLRLTFVGHLDTQEIVDAYLTSSIYVFPTLGDEWGLVVNEALAAGLPILASVHAQASMELIEEGVNGWLFDPEDAASLYQAIDRALSTPASALAEMSVQARKSVAEWTPETMAARMYQAIKAVTHRNPA